MGRRALLVMGAVLLMTVAGLLPVQAQGGTLPDLQPVDVSLCRLRFLYWYGFPSYEYRLTFSVANTSSVDAIPTSPPGEITVVGGVGYDASGRAANLVLSFPRIDAGARLGPYTVTGIEPNVAVVYGVEVDTYNTVQEASEANNLGGGTAPDRERVPWCPGRAPRAFGLAFLDSNRNGQRDAGEPGLGGVIVEVWQGSRRVAQTASGSDGSWEALVNSAGTYSLAAVVPQSVVNALGGRIEWTTSNRYFDVALTGGASGPYMFGIAVPPTPTPTATATWTSTPTPTPTPTVGGTAMPNM